jgi:pimeloyl-ACP methyl ester carboxylesterase
MSTRPTKFVHTSRLRIAYEEHGDPRSTPAILLHGWPDDARTWDRVVNNIAAAGYFVLVPHLRGFGETEFLSDRTPRSGSRYALVTDLFEFMDALGIDDAAVIGHDWGARTAYLAAGLSPDRVSACVAISVGWGTDSPDASMPVAQSHNYWYHWLMALSRGEEMVREHRREFVSYIWKLWNPEGGIRDEEIEATMQSFANPDWADVTLHSYRARWGLVEDDPDYRDVELAARRIERITVPTLVIHGEIDPCNSPSTSAGAEASFGEKYSRVVIRGAGHFPHRTAAEQVGRHINEFLLNLNPS